MGGTLAINSCVTLTGTQQHAYVFLGTGCPNTVESFGCLASGYHYWWCALSTSSPTTYPPVYITNTNRTEYYVYITSFSGNNVTYPTNLMETQWRYTPPTPSITATPSSTSTVTSTGSPSQTPSNSGECLCCILICSRCDAHFKPPPSSEPAKSGLIRRLTSTPGFRK